MKKLESAQEQGNIEECIHEKIYKTDLILCSNPPQMKWVCKKCLAEGTDYIGVLPVVKGVML